MMPTIRKIVTYIETTLIEGGRAAPDAADSVGVDNAMLSHAPLGDRLGSGSLTHERQLD